MRSERLPRQSLDPVAAHRVADGACSHRQAKPSVPERVRPGENGERAVGGTATFAIDRVEIGLAVQATIRRQ